MSYICRDVIINHIIFIFCSSPFHQNNALWSSMHTRPNYRRIQRYLSENLVYFFHDNLTSDKGQYQTSISEYNSYKTVTSPSKTRDKNKRYKDLYDKLELNVVHRHLHSFWFNKTITTLDKILQVINSDKGIPNTPNTPNTHECYYSPFRAARERRRRPAKTVFFIPI